MYPAWLELQVRHAATPRLEALGSLLGGGTDPLARVESVRESFGMTAGLGELGVRPEDVDVLVGAVTGDLSNDPLPNLNADAVYDLYMASR